MNIYALQTARAGSKSVPNKNILEISGHPLYLHNILHAKKSNYINDTFVSTDCSFIVDNSKKHDYKIIKRPAELCTDTASHHEAIKHGLLKIEENIGEKVDILIVLLGNTMTAYPKQMDHAIDWMLENDEIDSVQSISEFNMFNPFRALEITENGNLRTIMKQQDIKKRALLDNINDKNSAGNVYYSNGSFQVCRRRAIMGTGQLPFTWLGYRIIPYVQDVCMEIDSKWQLRFLKGYENEL